MIEKLETSEIDESKQLLLQNLETKIVDLQTQLRAVRATKGETGAPTPSTADSAAPTTIPVPGDLPVGGRGMKYIQTIVERNTNFGLHNQVREAGILVVDLVEVAELRGISTRVLLRVVR